MPLSRTFKSVTEVFRTILKNNGNPFLVFHQMAQILASEMIIARGGQIVDIEYEFGKHETLDGTYLKTKDRADIIFRKNNKYSIAEIKPEWYLKNFNSAGFIGTRKQLKRYYMQLTCIVGNYDVHQLGSEELILSPTAKEWLLFGTDQVSVTMTITDHGGGAIGYKVNFYSNQKQTELVFSSQYELSREIRKELEKQMDPTGSPAVSYIEDPTILNQYTGLWRNDEYGNRVSVMQDFNKIESGVYTMESQAKADIMRAAGFVPVALTAVAAVSISGVVIYEAASAGIIASGSITLANGARYAVEFIKSAATRAVQSLEQGGQSPAPQTAGNYSVSQTNPFPVIKSQFSNGTTKYYVAVN